jgi:hypothetical protein
LVSTNSILYRYDLVHITAALYPSIPATMIERMVKFTSLLAEAAGGAGQVKYSLP